MLPGLFLLSLSLSVLRGPSLAAPTVDLGYATYQGEYDAATNISSFAGVRYAASPVGALRWSPPTAPAPLEGLQDATSFGPVCFQAKPGSATSNPYPAQHHLRQADIDEDCLFLNVYSPGSVDTSTSGKPGLPVVVWIHGGGYIQGSGRVPGRDLVRESGGGVIAVAIQYRLGIFGFLAGQAVKDGGAMNVGLLDQQFALQWVQDHIAKFGGDPNRVTIWGESAGAGSVLQQIVAHNGHTTPPLFRAAITSSTFLPSQYAYNDEIPESIYNKVAELTNCASTSNTLACIRRADVSLLANVNAEIVASGFDGTFVFAPVVDGTFIVQRPTQAFHQGKVNGQRLLSVTNTNEGGPFVHLDPSDPVVVSDYVGELFPKLSNVHVDEATRLYGAAGLGEAFAQVVAIMSETIFVCPTYYLMDAFLGRSYKSKFAIPPGTHASDSVYFFPSNGPPPYTNVAFQKAFSESFLAFVMDLDPNETFEETITPQWRTYHGLPGRNEMLFNRTEGGEPLVEPFHTDLGLLARCLFWNSVGHETGQ